MKVLIGKKIGMTQVFDETTGISDSVTVVEVSGNVISKLFKNENEVTHIEVGKDKQKKSTKSDLGNYKTLKFVPKFKKVFKVNSTSSELEEGKELKADVFAVNDLVDVIGVTKGKGFAGVMKRWNFKGGKSTHGQSDRDRAPGSIGSGTTMGRVMKGLKMAGRMGRANQTVKNLKIKLIDVENNLLAVSGSIPGTNNHSYVIIKESKSKKKQ